MLYFFEMATSKEKTILTVTQLTRAIKDNLESDFRFVRISGEISNLKTPYSGHSYFTLKDSNAQIRGVLFKQQKRFVSLDLKDGQEVVCFGRVTVYEPRGDYQLILDSVELFGKGKLQREFEELKEKLSAKGYFDPEIKKEVPPYPKKIAVISSATGAALQDFLKIVRMRNAPLHIQIIPSLVQGKDAPADLVRAIKLAARQVDIDVIVLCRGGGSLEDLWAFNDEAVADAIHSCTIPIVTGIGHEIDFTITDFCADLRAPTPTAAAEALTADSASILAHVIGLNRRLFRSIQQRLAKEETRLNHSLKLLGSFSSHLERGEHRLKMSTSYLISAMGEKLTLLEARLQMSTARLQAQAPVAKIRLQESHVSNLKRRLSAAIEATLARKRMELGAQAALLNSVSPLATLARGYSIVRKQDYKGRPSKVITDSGSVSKGDAISVLLHKGEMDCVVVSTEK